MSHDIQTIKKLLVANRGEIACRVFKTAKRLGLGTIAIYSEPDQHSLHANEADEAFCVGPASATESYLNIPAILAVAKRSGAAAIHPGYGFLSENARFAQAVIDAGLKWIGPPPGAIEAMGSKSEAKRLMESAGVPLLQGYHGQDQQDDRLLEAARSIGFPVMLKASAGGGGKGMRVVDDEQAFAEALTGARREALTSFADDMLLLEKYLPSPRHIEVQVFFDDQGSGIYLADRDCSVQRRHQKVVEEAPAPGLDDATRKAMGSAAVAAARVIGYSGAGTVEFLLNNDGQFYFMEMNTRLQVEHPVTEMITGQDLVEWQLLVADGQPLPLSQEEVKVNGHAIESRLYAEQVQKDFMPATGEITHLAFPDESARVRVETGVRPGDLVSPYYDPMLAKLVVWGESRDLAIVGMRSALQDTRIAGLSTNRDFLIRVLDNTEFCAVNFSTGLIEQHRAALVEDEPEDHLLSLAVAALWRLHQLTDQQNADPWLYGEGWRLNLSALNRFRFVCRDRIQDVRVSHDGDSYHCLIDGETLAIDKPTFMSDGIMLPGEHGGLFSIVGQEAALTIVSDRLTLDLSAPDHDVLQESGSGFNAPMNGTIVSVQVKAGDQVQTDAPLLVMEAMKMEHTIRAPCAGEIAEIFFKKGDLVEEGVSLLAMIREEDSVP